MTRSRLKGLFLRLLFSLVLFLGLLEAGLRLFAHKLPHPIANDVVLCYSNRPGGMYYVDHIARTNFLLPNADLPALFNGYRWRHQTDSRGFRNPPNASSEVVLLGDSFIYGHCVEEEKTVAAYLRREHGWKVYNLARQGDFLTTQYLMLRLYFDDLKPRRVILFPFGNDFQDTLGSRSPERIADPPELDAQWIEATRERVLSGRHRGRMLGLLDHSYLVRLCLLLKKIHERRPQPEEGPREDPALTSLKDPEKFRSVSQHYRRVFADMVRLCREGGAELEVVFIDTGSEHGDWREVERRIDAFLRELCQEFEVKYSSTRNLLEGHPERKLEGDGHLSPEGHRVLADFLASDKS